MPPEPSFSSEQTELIREFNAVLPLFAAPGRVAVTLGGSQAKQKSDARSDFDFRVYADTFHTEDWPQSPGWAPFQETLQRWEARGYRIDGFWPRKIADVDAALDRWIAGEIEPVHLVWTVWGYHLPTDIYAQYVVSDPDGVAAGWKARLRVYPPALKASILRKHLEFLRYWRDDYHYVNKVERGDRIFLAGLSAKLVQSICQILFALNETYYVGDGWNEPFLQTFPIAPPDIGDRIAACLYPAPGADVFVRQRAGLIDLINEVEALIPAG